MFQHDLRCQLVFVCCFCFTSSMSGLRISEPLHLVLASATSSSKCNPHATVRHIDFPGIALGVQNCVLTFRTKPPRDVVSS
jgi:hypothetical protein